MWKVIQMYLTTVIERLWIYLNPVLYSLLSLWVKLLNGYFTGCKKKKKLYKQSKFLKQKSNSSDHDGVVMIMNA